MKTQITSKSKCKPFDINDTDFPVLVSGNGQIILIADIDTGIILTDESKDGNIGYVFRGSEMTEGWEDYVVVSEPITITFSN